MKEKTVAEIKEEIAKRMRKQSFIMSEEARGKEIGEYTEAFMWSKATYEALEGIMWFIDSNFTDE